MITINDIVDFDFTNHASVLECIALLQSIVTNNNLISSETKFILDVPTRDDVFDEIDRDFWIHCLIRQFNPAISRLPWRFGSHNSPGFYDPLGLALLNPGQTYFIDSSNNDAVYVGALLPGAAYPNPQPLTNNKVYSDAARTTEIGDLWPSTLATIPNFTLFKDILYLHERGTGVRRYSGDATQVTIYVCGGTYQAEREFRIVRQVSGTVAQTRIKILKYPGEISTVRCANSLSPNDARYLHTPMFLVQRPSVYWGVDVLGNIDLGGGLFRYAPFLFQVTGSVGNDFHPVGARLTGFRSIPPDDAGAASFPGYVCQQWHNRVTTAGTNTTNHSTWGIQYSSTVGNAGSARWCYIKGADLDFPTRFGGEDIDLSANVHHFTAAYTQFDGHAPHARIRAVDFNTHHTTVEYCSFEHGDLRLLLNGHSDVVRYNRLRVRTMFAGDTVYGMQVHTDSDVYGNVVWGKIAEIGTAQAFGIVLSSDKDFPDGVTKRTRVHHNVVHLLGIGVFYTGGFNIPVIPLIEDNIVDHNIIIDLPPENKLEPLLNAPIYTNIGVHDPDWYGHTFPTNLISRLDGDDTVVVERVGPNDADRTDYTINTLPSPQFDGCFSADPKFVDPENGDFTLQPDSPIIGWFDADAPFIPLQLLPTTCYEYLSQFIEIEPEPEPEPEPIPPVDETPKTIFSALIHVWIGKYGG